MIHLKKFVAAHVASESEFVICDRETGDTFCSVPVGKSQEDAHLRASRIVHGMNAIEGIDTNELAEIAATGGMLGPREDIARIAKQRNELLALVKKIKEWDISDFALAIPVGLREEMQRLICEAKGGA